MDWSQAIGVGKSLLFSPLVGFLFAGLLLLILKAVLKVPALYQEPPKDQAPPFWIRCLLILTCTGVSFAHGSNDGQKGMGLIMLILIGTVPTAYALNKAVTPAESQTFVAVAHQAAALLRQVHQRHRGAGQLAPGSRDLRADARAEAGNAAGRAATVELAGGRGRLDGLDRERAARRCRQRAQQHVPGVGSDPPDGEGQAAGLRRRRHAAIDNYRQQLDHATKFIPTWVKVAVAMALGLGTMVGWKRIVVTVGEKIGKQHLTYGQGASAEAVAMITIGAADMYGLPVSTTHVLSSGVAGTMAANGSGLQWTHRAQPAPGLGADAAGVDRAGRPAVLGVPLAVLIRHAGRRA